MRFAFRRNHDSADSPSYLSLLKLHTPPFAASAASAGSGFFYADAERTQYLDMLQHLTQYSEELLLVVGDAGLGKSALIDKYLERGEEHWRLCRLNGGQGIDLDGLFRRVAECFAVELSGVAPPQLIDALRQHLDALLEQQLSVLVIDDADALSDDALEMVFHLAALEGEHGRLIRVLLFADSAIETRLASARFAQLVAPHRLQLKPLTESDSSGYLLHRLQQAGYSGLSPFSAADLRQLHRQSHGVPARLNEAAHTLLLERTKEGAGHVSGTGRTIKVGVAATALIGTMLGMHERINSLLGGEPDNSMAVTAERPVLRLADSDNPWAVVIRDGESIQISCGRTAAETVAVRPVPAAAALDSQTLMARPLMRAVSVPEEAEAPATVPPTVLAAEGDIAAEAAPQVVVAAVTPAAPAEPSKSVESAHPAEPTAPIDTPATPPLVIKAPTADGAPASAAAATEEEAAASAAVAKKEEPATPQRLALEGVIPNPVIGSDQPQTITLLGSGLVPESKVAVSWSGKVKALEPSQVVVRDASRMEITITTGVEPSTWAVQVSTPDKQRSNVLRFVVEAPKPGAVDVEAKAPSALEPASQPEAQPAAQVEPPATTVTTAPTAQPVPDATPPAKQMAAASTPVKRAASPQAKKAATAQDRTIRTATWIASQPDDNYTLQLLASGDEQALQRLVADTPQLTGPLGSFQQQSGDKRLHVLTRGSYPDRTAAEAAAKALPGGLQPWIRDFAGIKRVMSPTAPVVADGGGIKDTAWVWSQNPAEYTIQLAGASDEAAIEAVMATLSLPGELAVVQGRRNGAPWYTLVYGRFATKEAAQGTVARLPAALRQAGPWIRQFSALHGEISRAATR